MPDRDINLNVNQRITGAEEVNRSIQKMMEYVSSNAEADAAVKKLVASGKTLAEALIAVAGAQGAATEATHKATQAAHQQEQQWRRVQAAHQAAIREEVRRYTDPGFTLAQPEARVRAEQLALEAAHKENLRRAAAEEAAWRRVQAAHAAAINEDVRRTRAPIVAFEREEASWRRMQGLHQAAITEDQRRTRAAEREADRRQRLREREVRQQQMQYHNLAYLAATYGASELGIPAPFIAGRAITNMLQPPAGGGGGFAAGIGGVAGVAGIAGMLGTGLFAAGTIKMAQDIGNYARETENLAARTGLNITQTQEYSRAADVLGVKINALAVGMKTLSRVTSDSTVEGRRQREALTEIGVASDMAYAPMARLLPAVFQGLKSIQDPLEKERLAIELFGRGAAELLPLIDRFQDVRKAVIATGAVLDEEGIKKAAEYRRQITLIGQEWTAMTNRLKLQAVGVVTIAINWTSAQAGGRGFWPGIMSLLSGQGGMYGISSMTATPPAPGMPEAPPPPEARSLLVQQRREFMTRYNISAGAGYDEAGRLQNRISQLDEDRKSLEQRYMNAPEAAPGRMKWVRDEQGQFVMRRVGENVQAEQAFGQIRAIDRETQLLREQIKALQEIEQWRRKLADYRRNEAVEGLTPIAREIMRGRLEVIQAPRSLRQETADVFNLPQPGRTTNLQRLRDAEMRRVAEEWQKEQDKAEKFGGKQFGRELRTRQDIYEHGLDIPLLGIHIPSVAEMKQFINEFHRTDRARLEAESEAATAGGQWRGRMMRVRGEMQGLPPGEAAYQQLQATMSTLNTELAIKRTRTDLFDMTREETEARTKGVAAIYEYEERIAEAQMRQQRQFQHLATGVFHAATQGRAGAFMREQALGWAGTAVGNIAGMAWPAISQAVPSFGGPLGRILEGTPFGPRAQDKLGLAGDKLSVASDKLQDAADSLIKASGGTPTGRSGAAGAAGAAASTAARFLPSLRSLPALVRSIGSIFHPGSGAAGAGADAGPTGEELGDFAGTVSKAAVGTSGAAVAKTGTSQFVKDLGYAAAAAGAAFMAHQSFSAGGARNALAGASAVMGGAAMIPSPASPFLAVGAAGAGMASAMFGDSKQQRAHEISQQLKYNWFFAPEQMNVSAGVGGGYLDYNRFGGMRSSDLSPYPVVQEPYADWRHNVMVPGRVTSPYGGPGGGSNVTVNQYLQTYDTNDYIRNSDNIAAALDHALQNDRARGLQTTLRNM